MADERCPKCGSANIGICRGRLTCSQCGFVEDEDYIDFPYSYAWRAYYAETLEGVSLPSIELPEHTLGELAERLAALEKYDQSSEKSRLEVNQPQEKPKPKLIGGVKL